MTIKPSRAYAAIIAIFCLYIGSGAHTQTRTPSPNAVQKEKTMTNHARGAFDVKMTPQASDDKTEDATPGRFLIDKQYHGDIEGTGKGQMLGAMTPVKGSAGYVAIERVSGTLQGRNGSFVLQHSGTMTRGAMELTITVVPDSGTGQLTGITGKMDIKMTDGKHFYEFDYTLPETH